MSGKTDAPTILIVLTKVGEWNGNVFNLAAPIPIMTKFCCTFYIRVSTVSHMITPKRCDIYIPQKVVSEDCGGLVPWRRGADATSGASSPALPEPSPPEKHIECSSAVEIKGSYMTFCARNSYRWRIIIYLFQF